MWAPPGLMQSGSSADSPFSDSVVIRVVDDSLDAAYVYDLLCKLGDIQHVDFTYFAFSQSIRASFFDCRQVKSVLSALQNIPGLTCAGCQTESMTQRTTLVPLSLPSATGDNMRDLSSRLITFLSQFGDIEKIELDNPNNLKVCYFDARAKQRLAAKIAAM